MYAFAAKSTLRHHPSTTDLDLRALTPNQLLHLQRALGNKRVAELVSRKVPVAHRAIESGPTRPEEILDASVNAEMKSRFGHDFSQIRVHHDDAAAAAADAVDARAFTIGTDIVFGRGEYVPQSSVGRDLIAHELAHVVEQSSDLAMAAPIVQRQRQPTRPQPRRGDDTVRHGDYSFFAASKSGITIKVGVQTTDELAVRSKISDIVAEIAAANSAIKESAMQVRLCVIAPTTSRFALYQGMPVLLLDPSEPAATAAHEMTHAIFHAFTHKGPRADSGRRSPPTETAVRIADIYLRLGQTKEETRKVPDVLGGLKEEPHPVGFWMVDPTSWAGSSKPEHPWADPDEFFASAREAFRIDPQGLRQAIKRASIVDPKVTAPAEELLKLLAEVPINKPPSGQLPVTRRDPAIAALSAESEPGKLEDTIDSPANQLLRWALDPSKIKTGTVP